MNRTDCETLIEHLRAELAAYGTLVAHFERQQRSLFLPDPDALLELSESIDAAVLEADGVRRSREACMREIAFSLGLPESTTLREMVPLAPDVFQPMLESFVREINRLVDSVRRRGHRNHQMLARVCQLHREALQTARHGFKATTYGAGGRLQSPISPAFQVAG